MQPLPSPSSTALLPCRDPPQVSEPSAPLKRSSVQKDTSIDEYASESSLLKKSKVAQPMLSPSELRHTIETMTRERVAPHRAQLESQLLKFLGLVSPAEYKAMEREMRLQLEDISNSVEAEMLSSMMHLCEPSNSASPSSPPSFPPKLKPVTKRK